MRILLHQPKQIAHAERYLAIHVASLKEAGHDVIVDQREWDPGAACHLIKQAQDERADVLHFLTADGGRAAFLRLAVRMPFRRLKVFATYHNYPRLTDSLVGGLFTFLLWRRLLTGLVIPSGSRDLLPTGWRDRSKVCSVYEPLLRSPAKVTAKSKKTVLFIGTVTREKGVLDFLRFLDSQGELPGLTGLVAGECLDPELNAELVAFAKASGGRVTLDLRRLSEGEFEHYVRSAALVWCAYPHQRGSGVAYRAIELGTPILAHGESVAGSLIKRFGVGLVYSANCLREQDDLMGIINNRALNCASACKILSSLDYGHKLTRFYDSYKRN